MISYIFKRLGLIGFIGMVILFVLSFFLPNYWYTHYHDVHIVSSKNTIVKHCQHEEHHYNGKLIVWKGTDDNGIIHTIESEVNVDDPHDTTGGVCYYDLKNGIAKTFNLATTAFTIVGLIALGIVSVFAMSENLEDYGYNDCKNIRILRLFLFNVYMIFCGHDQKILHDICEEEYNNKAKIAVIPKYLSLYDEYKKRVNELNK